MKLSSLWLNDWRGNCSEYGYMSLVEFNYFWEPKCRELTIKLLGLGCTICLRWPHVYAPLVTPSRDEYAADDAHPYQDAEALQGNIITPAGAQSFNPINQRHEE